MDSAAKFGRKVVLSGKSLIKNSEIATRLNMLTYPENLIIDIDAMNRFPLEKIVIVGTGSQGEPMSALTRMASGEFNKVKIQESDTIIISAAPIPGNERAIYGVINNLYKRGADVIYEALQDVHVSGHACKEELKLLHSLIKPRFFMPVHGEYRHLKQHAMLAESLGMSRKNILISAIGNVVEVRKDSITINGTVEAGTTYIDGITVGETDSGILSDRRKLSGDGIMIILVELQENVISDPIELIARGIMITEEFTNEIKIAVAAVVEKFNFDGVEDRKELKNVIRKAAKKLLWNKLNKSPMIIPLIMED
jgi:ribonuclease J